MTLSFADLLAIDIFSYRYIIYTGYIGHATKGSPDALVRDNYKSGTRGNW